MKKFTFGLLTLIALSVASPAYSNAAPEIKQTEVTTITDAEAQALVDRLHEINDLDKSKLSREERKELRAEVMAIRDQLDGHPVIYVSGGLILLIILLILLL